MRKISPLSILLLAAFTIGAQEIQNREVIQSEYDKFADKTFVSAPERHLEPANKSEILFKSVSLIAGFQHSGQVLTRSNDLYVLSFIVRADTWRFLESNRRKLTILADEKRVVSSDGERSGKVLTTRGKVETREIITFGITLAELKTIADSKTTELQIGWFETSLSDEDKRVLKLLILAGTPKP